MAICAHDGNAYGGVCLSYSTSVRVIRHGVCILHVLIQKYYFCVFSVHVCLQAMGIFTKLIIVGSGIHVYDLDIVYNYMHT